MLATSTAAARPAVLPLFATAPAPDRVSGLFHAAIELARLLGQGRALDSRALRAAMEAAFGASDAAGAWAWKDSYEAAEERRRSCSCANSAVPCEPAPAPPPRCSRC